MSADPQFGKAGARNRLSPNVAPLSLRPNHRGIGAATPHFLKLWQVGERADHTILGDGMRIGLHHQALGLDANLVAAELSPCDEKLLLGVEAVDIGGTRFALQRLFVGEERHFRTAQVSDAFAQHQLAVVMNAGLDEVVVELIGYAGGAGLELLQVGVGPPIAQAAEKVVLRALIVEAVGDFVADDCRIPAGKTISFSSGL